MSAWTLDGDECNLLSCNLGVARTDVAQVELRAGMATPPADGSWVTLACDGTAVLYGRTRKSRTVSGANDAVRVVIEGPWAVLEETVYQQEQAVVIADAGEPGGYALASILTPEVQLGMDDAGALRTTSQEIVAILTYAAGAGADITWDVDFTGRNVPIVTMEGSTCAACLLAMLDHHPEVVAFFSYTTGAAELRLWSLAGLDVVTLSGGPEGTDRVAGAGFRQVIDYKPAGIRIVSLRVGEFGFLETTTPDTAGSIGTEGKAPGVLNWVVRLEGADPGPLEEQEIKTRPIPDNTETEGKTNFWQRHLPWMTPALAADITITEHTRTVDPPGVDADPTGGVPEETYSLDPDDYPRELVSGAVRPWMQAESAPLTVTAKFAWSGATLTDAVRAVFGPSGTDVREFAVQLTGTDASTRIYRALSAGAALPEFPAPGLASAFLSAFSGAVWEGNATVTGEDQPLIFPGRKLNVTGFETAWGTMAALIQSVSFSADAHSVSVTCGPPRAMDFGDFYSLQRVFKKRQYLSEAAAYERRVEAKPGRGGRVRGGTRSPMKSVSTGGGGAGTAPASGLQTVIRKVGADWNVGVTAGIVQAVSAVTPTLEPAGTGLTAAITYFAYAIDATAAAAAWDVWLLVVFDDSDFYAGDVAAAEVHLLSRAAPPDPVYVSGDSQWFLIGSASTDGVGGMTSVSHILNSARVVRRGGPGSGYQVYSA